MNLPRGTHRIWIAGIFLSLINAVLPGEPVISRDPSSVKPELYARTMKRAAQLPRLHSLLVSVDGELVEEQYFNGAKRWRWANLKSASKSVLSSLIGIALDRGYLESLQDPVVKFFPEYFDREADPSRKTITLEDLLTMRSGMESTSSRNYGGWVQSRNWVRHVLMRPMVEPPGSRMIYSTGNTHLLSAILTQATGMSTLEFARQYLGKPLSIQIHPWMRDPQGIYFGGNEMHLTPRAMLEIGKLYLNHGLSGRTRVVSKSWIQNSLKPRTYSPRNGYGYGFGWWNQPMITHQVYFAWGYGGQFIFIVPDLRLVVVVTSSPRPGRGRREHRQAILDLLERDILPAIAQPSTNQD